MSYDTPSSISLPLKIKIEHKDGLTGREINFFFSNNHLAPKFFKVVTNSKQVHHHF